MPNVTIKNMYNLDGEYPLEMVFTHRDFRDIKKIAGVRANEVLEAINAGDLDVMVALCAIALRRAQKQFDIEQLWDAETGNITIDLTDDEESPPLAPASEPRSSDDGNSSGSTTNGSTESSPEIKTPRRSGTPEQAPT